MKETYKCAMCGGVFVKSVPEEEALVELHELFGEGISPEDCDIVCEDCWQGIRPDILCNEEVFAAWQKEK